ncbi:hypothetical protein IE81DRAFT_344822 [Ceraceosorus guamensis]|uniref:UBC core domain-containing protein n=1 Tax=Ceraceosorus guamensis TaxID=1522189 RepID=A0A316W9W9_9BASI|nr:hypothetical protein IE81DRAFT_344822 [Ceraceosorus guamensis]PWN45521.1 hypothetical protein IE81DRAFT_344822 [Ceraceosorus guamensis]
MSNRQIAQLMDMGINRAVAVAALAASRDVEDAAEAVFSGKFDHIEADAEAEDASVVEEADSCSLVGGDEQASSHEDEGCGLSTFSDDDLGGAGETSNDNDPYRRIAFSKGHKEVVIEVEEVGALVQTSTGPARQLTQTEWMKGVAVGSEQAHLFGLYQDLQQTVSCHRCGLVPELESDFNMLLIFPSLKEFVAHVTEHSVLRCRVCQEQTCVACRQSYIEQMALPQAECPRTKSPGKDVSSSSEPPLPAHLVHCSQLQAICLAVGLAHIEDLLKCEDVKNHASSLKRHRAANAAEGMSAAKKANNASASTESKSNGRKKASNLASQTPANLSMSSYSLLDDHSFYTSLGKSRSDRQNGTGFAGSSSNEHFWTQASNSKQQALDERIREALFQVRPFLPDVHRKPLAVQSDFMPHITSIAAVRRRFLPIASALLRTESLNDMTRRAALFQELLNFFQTLSYHEALSALLAQPIMTPRSVRDVVRTDGRTEKEVTYEGDKGPRELAQNVVNQCLVFRNSVKRMQAQATKEEAEKALVRVASEAKVVDKEAKVAAYAKLDAEGQRTMELVESFISQVDRIDAGLRHSKGEAFLNALLAQVGGAPSKFPDDTISAQSKGERQAAYAAWCASETWQEVDMLETGKVNAWQHAFSDIIATTSVASNARRGLAIARELSSLRIALPDTIFVRVDESRLDVLKAMIIGPEGTPYSYGAYCFDIFLPDRFNQEPPKVKIVSTSGGRVRHNPNLYAEGKVCLSLLGTWTGPGWISGTSTILQVLISIQSLILGESEPCTNEPGWESFLGKPKSKEYSLNTRRQAVKVAMIEALTSPPAFWENTIRGHFKMVRHDLLGQLASWLKEDDGRPMARDSASGMHSLPSPSASAAVAAPQKKNNGSKTPFETDGEPSR